MDSIINLVVMIIAAVLITTILYKVLPFRNLSDTKPGFTLFPKYVVSFDKPVADIESALTQMKFRKTESDTYTRGKVYGDFSAKSIKLAVQIDQGQGQIKVYAPFFGILFDTGDLWQVTTDILNA